MRDGNDLAKALHKRQYDEWRALAIKLQQEATRPQLTEKIVELAERITGIIEQDVPVPIDAEEAERSGSEPDSPHDGDASVAAELLDDFRASLPEAQALLQSASQESDRQGVYAVAHRLAGSAVVVGASSVRAAADRLQTLAGNPEVTEEEIRETVADLLAEMQRFGAGGEI